VLRKYAPSLLVAHLSDRTRDTHAQDTRFDAFVLFVDIVESTALTDQYARRSADGAEQLASVLNGYFGRVIDLATAHGGDTFRIDGDAAVVVWRSEPGGDRECAYAAAAAAVEIREAFAADTALRHRISLVTGSVRLVVCYEPNGRGHCFVDGGAIRALGDAALRGEPGQIVLSDPMRAALGAGATCVRAACGAHALERLTQAHVPRPLPSASGQSGALASMLRAFVAKVIVDRSDAGQSDWIAEFRILTAVYVNLRNLDPDAPDFPRRAADAVRAIAAVVNPLGTPITSTVANEKGFLVQVVCGLPPYAQEHGAALAVSAALEVRDALAQIGVATAVGIATGEAFCGDIGSAQRREYVSTGLVMAYAARLMQAAGDDILCDEATAQGALGRADFSAARDIHVKGRSAPLRVRTVRKRTPAARDTLAQDGALFGRDEELRTLRHRLDGLAEGLGGVVAVEAEPGAGKTHLLAHAVREARASGYAVVAAVTSQVDEATPYFALRTMLAQLLRRDGDVADLPPETLGQRLAERICDRRLASRVALLEDVLPLGMADKGLAPEIKGQARLAGIEEVLAHLVADCAAAAPLVIVVDDLHWIDASSAHVLTGLMRHAPRALILAASRPVELATSSHVASFLATARPVLRLARLSSAAIAAIIEERLGSANVAPALVDFIQSRAEGLPFFAEQLLFALRDRGLLRDDGGRTSLAATDLSTVVPPDSLRELIMSRIDRLPADRQLAIKVASAVGRVFDVDTLREVHPLADAHASLDERLDRLADAGLLVRASEGGRPAFAFRHGIIQAVTYELLPYAQRRPLHRRIALHLEVKHRDALAPHFATLADHWERAAEAARAIPFRIGAADMAAQRYANHEAINHLDRVERLVSQFGVTLAREELVHCERIRADACQELTQFAEADAHYRKLAQFARIPVPATRMQTIAGIGVESIRQALRRCAVMRSLSTGDAKVRDGLAAHIYMRFAEHAYFTNDTLGLAHGTLASLNYAERAQSLPEIVNASGGLALGLAAMGLLRWASYYRERSIALATDAGSPSAQGFAELLACVQSFHTGEWDRMGGHGARGARIWGDLGDRYRHQACLVLEAYRSVATGRYTAARQVLAAFGENGEEIESVQVRAWALAALALVDLVLGQAPAAAIARIERANAAGDLNPAESLLCNGIAAAAYLEAGDRQTALRVAEAGLANIRQGSPAMAGALLFSVPAIAEVLLVLAQDAGGLGRTRDELLELATAACGAAQGFASRNRICRPRASLLRGHLAATRGRRAFRRRFYSEALAEAKRIGLPLEEAMSHFALAQLDETASGEAHRGEAGRIVERLGVAWQPWRRFQY
jgi:class 3 adenylate cyclase